MKQLRFKKGNTSKLGLTALLNWWWKTADSLVPPSGEFIVLAYVQATGAECVRLRACTGVLIKRGKKSKELLKWVHVACIIIVLGSTTLINIIL